MITSSSTNLRLLTASLVLAAPFALSACGSGDDSAAPGETTAAADGECPATPVDVVVSVDQWGDIVSQLGGACANVTTVLASSAVDPHDYEPAPSDAVLFDGAQLVVINGGHYDEWAAKLAATSAPDAPVVNAVELGSGHAGEDGHEHEDAAGHDHEGESGHDHDHEGEAGHDAGEVSHDHAGEGNPHVWYSPSAVTLVAEAVTAQLSELAPDASGYFDERRTAFANVMTPYNEVIAAIAAGAEGRSFAATESVFDDMGAALGLQNRTPEGYQLASANEAEPTPADLDAFLRLLGDRGVDVLIYNTQTEGSIPEQLRAAADDAGVPVVEVTETVPPNTESFQTWQVAQLDSLAEALGVSA